ncbi:hypothetical protein RY27_12930, partial [Litorilinea aerophila]
MSRREEEYLIQEALLNRLRRGQMDRRQFMTRMLAAGLGLSGVSAAIAGCMPAPAPAAPQAGSAASSQGAASSGERPLTPTFYQWIVDLHPSIPEV